MTQEMIEKARQAKTVEEILALAKENSMEMTEEDAKLYFEQLHPVTGELSDDELDNVSGGGCKTNGGYTTVTSELKCFNGCFLENFWQAQYANGDLSEVYMKYNQSNSSLRKIWKNNCSGGERCGRCAHLEFNGGIGYCGVSK